jgi:diacylglycerol O-acyltransferase
VFTRKLALMPFDLADPVWVEDEDIDIDHHVRHITLPKPGTNRQLQQYVARLHSSLLDRSRPLWECSSSTASRAARWRCTPRCTTRASTARPAWPWPRRSSTWRPPAGSSSRRARARAATSYQLGIAELASAAARNTVRQYAKLIRMAPSMARAVRDVVVPEKDEHGKRHWSLPDVKVFAPRTLLNVAITNQRSFAGRTIPLAETKFIAKTFGVTAQRRGDGTTAGALRRYLRDRRPARQAAGGRRAGQPARAGRRVGQQPGQHGCACRWPPTWPIRWSG